MTVLIVALPVLAAATGLGVDPDAGEVAALHEGIADPGGAHGGPAALFFGTAAHAAGEPSTDGEILRAMASWRAPVLLGILCISGLAFVAVATALGRVHAALTLIVLAMLPPIAVDGARLRAEVPVAVFSLLAVAVLVLTGDRLASLRGRGVAPRVVRGGSISAVTATAVALAVASLPRYGVVLLVPGSAMLFAAALAVRRFVVVVHRRRMVVLPFFAVFLRILPWLATAFLALVVTAAMPGLDVDRAPASSAVGLWPGSSWLAAPMAILAVLGGAAWIWRMGMRVTHGLRLDAEVVLFLFAGVMLIHRLRLGEGADALPAAVPLAIVVAAGAKFVLGALGARRA